MLQSMQEWLNHVDSQMEKTKNDSAQKQMYQQLHRDSQEISGKLSILKEKAPTVSSFGPQVNSVVSP